MKMIEMGKVYAEADRHKDIGKIKLGHIIWLLLIAQICWTFFVVGQKVIYRSTLPLWLNSDYFREEKVNALLGRDYLFSKNAKDLPQDANYLMLAPDIGSNWFVNYYFFPRKLFWHDGITTEADMEKLPAGWLKAHDIDYAIVFRPPEFRVLKVDSKPGAIK